MALYPVLHVTGSRKLHVTADTASHTENTDIDVETLLTKVKVKVCKD